MIKAARISEKVNGIRIDITIKNNTNHVFAPTWNMVLDYKNAKITWAQYDEMYFKLMAERAKTRSAEIDAIARMAIEQDVYFICFCTDDRVCHRRLACEIIEKRIKELQPVKQHPGLCPFKDNELNAENCEQCYLGVGCTRAVQNSIKQDRNPSLF